MPVSDTFVYWTGALANYTAFAPHGWLVKTVFLPHIFLLQPAIYLTEIFFTVALPLGLATRLASLLAVLFTVQLWIGPYNDPTEWPWTYIAIIVAQAMFIAAEARRSLGLDHLLRKHPPAFVARHWALQRAFDLAA